MKSSFTRTDLSIIRFVRHERLLLGQIPLACTVWSASGPAGKAEAVVFKG